MTKDWKNGWWMGMIGVLLLLTACGGKTPPSAFYALSALDGGGAPIGSETREIRVGVGPIRLPDYLNRPQIVIRQGANRLIVDEFHRWGGSLEEDLLRILTENLGMLLGSEQVRIYSEELDTPDCRVRLSLQRFEGTDQQRALLKGSWSIVGPRTGKLLKTGEGLFQAPAAGADYESLVNAMSDAVAAMSREIAADIERLYSGRRRSGS